VVSRTLKGPLDWPDATVVNGDAVEVVARLKQESEVPLRSHGSLSMNRALMAAGCDMILHCSGKLDEMQQVAREAPELSGKALERARRALASRKAPQPFDQVAARAQLDALIDQAGMTGA